MRSTNFKKYFSIFAIFILITGIVMTVYNLRTGKFKKSENKIVDAGIDKNATPLFEIGYLLIDISIFNGIIKKDSTGVSGDFMYPVFNTDITKRISTNSPLIAPDYSKIPYPPALEAFIKLYKKRKLKLAETWVACLLIKQKGKGKAINTILEYDKANVNTTDMYDGTDINNIIFRWYDSSHTESVGFVKNFESGQFALDTMNMNNNVLIPVCILNLFRRIKPENIMDEEEAAWTQVTNGTILVPRILKYGNLQGDTVHINIEEFLQRPILVSK